MPGWPAPSGQGDPRQDDERAECIEPVIPGGRQQGPRPGPAGDPAAAHLHVARTTCRRAERLIVELASHEGEKVSDGAIAYINRLSDFFFVASRWVNYVSGNGDVLWVPGKTR